MQQVLDLVKRYFYYSLPTYKFICPDINTYFQSKRKIITGATCFIRHMRAKFTEILGKDAYNQIENLILKQVEEDDK